MNYIKRTLETSLSRAAREFPVIVLTGPRQSGKTTILKRLFGDTHRYLSMELPDLRAAALGDPRGFLDMYPPPLLLDEVQYTPELLPYIKERVDADRASTGRFVLTGSQNLLLAQHVTESLAGRAAMLRLLPLCHGEVIGRPEEPLFWERKNPLDCDSRWAHAAMWGDFVRGGYPELALGKERDLALWHGSYVQTYLERDVRSLRQVGDLGQFQSFLRLLAAHSAQLLNLAELAREAGISVNTAKAWLSVLEATYQVFLVRPYFRNIGKRLVKAPKIYFGDVGTLCYLCGIREPHDAKDSPMCRAIMENAVFCELVRALTHTGRDPLIYFWRTVAGAEVDFLLDMGQSLIPVEVKSSGTPRPAMARSIEAFWRDIGVTGQGYVIHGGDTALPLKPGITALPFGSL